LVSLTFLAATTRLVVLPRLVVLTTLLATLAGLLVLLTALALPALILILAHVASFLIRPMREKWRIAVVRSDVQRSKNRRRHRLLRASCRMQQIDDGCDSQ
jgi:hypothetical protein